MNNEQQFQVDLFNYIKEKLPDGASLVDEVSDLLSISNDSAYRRIRGDKFMVLPELIRLCSHFEIPLNELVEVSDSRMVSFSTQFIRPEDNSVQTYLETVRDEMRRINKAEDHQVLFILNDLNLFQMLQVPELAAFKFFFWQKSGLGSDSHSDMVFEPGNFQQNYTELVREIIGYYLKINTDEMITPDALDSAKKQVVYYYDMGFIKDRSTAVLLLEKLIELADHVRKQAENGKKYAFGYSPDDQNGTFNLYYNTLSTIENLILLKYDDREITYITNNMVNLMKSSNPSFYEYNYLLANNLIKRAELISGTGERVRNKAFRDISERIQSTLDQI